MPVPILISELSQVAGSNFPAGSDSPSNLDDVQRAQASFIALLRDGKGLSSPVTLASAATTDIGGQNSVAVEISGTTGITSFGTNYNGPRYLRFTGVLLLTHGASLNLPGAANITTAAGDTCIAYPNSALSGWNVVSYQRAAFTPQTAAPAQSGANSDITSLTGLTSAIAEIRQIQPISASVAANALTISASALSLEFRSATLTSGAVAFVEGTPANLVVPSAATLGTVSAVQSRIVVLALNNAGTIELAVVNISGGNDLSETGLISTTAISAGSTSASVVYSTTARTSVAYRVIGYTESTQATAGTWATAPSTIQGVGGQALTAMSSLGYGQTWQDVSGSRVIGTTYYNTTGKPISLSIRPTGSGAGTSSLTVAGLIVSYAVSTTPGVFSTMAAVVPLGNSYSAAGPAVVWHELR